MKFHKEGHFIISSTLFSLLVINLITLYSFFNNRWIVGSIAIISLVFLGIILQFFRNPKRKHFFEDAMIIAPADGKVVVIEEVQENEFIKGKCKQVSIFMSPFNVHVNRYPCSGRVKYVKYHPGKYLVAWHPKSSTENERTTIAIEHESGKLVLFRQIAGALAKRIVWYSKEEATAKQNEEFGFIKFGSRVDIYLPLDAEILVNLKQKTKGGVTPIARL